MHYYSHNVGDYRRDTSHLSLLEHGVYRQLMDTYYLSEKPLSSDHAVLMRTHSARSADEMQAFENVLKDFFVLTDAGYIHKRCDVEIEAFHAKSSSARESAKARWDRVKEERKADAMRTHSEGNANQEPITINQELENQEHLSSSTPPTQKPERKEPAFKRILEIYNEVCKGRFKGAAEITTERRKNITKCWNRKVNGKLVFQSGQFWSDYFTWCLRDPHWCGETGNWKASLDFVTRTSSVDRIIDEMTLEGVFDHEPA